MELAPVPAAVMGPEAHNFNSFFHSHTIYYVFPPSPNLYVETLVPNGTLSGDKPLQIKVK